ncbi:MAG: glycosyltransferase family 2 protein [Bacillota bacterium]|nr:glycosyltransferase family 2 protein [Bacillota bacterium]
MKRVLIASPVRQKPAILKEFLWSLERLETTGLSVSYAFVDDAEESEGNELLRQFAEKYPEVRLFPGEGQERGAGQPCPEQPGYFCDETTHHWNIDLINKVARYKDRFLRLAREEGYDFLFLVDSDLILHPKTLVHLVSLGKDIVSEVFWTKWFPDLPPLPQVWVADDYRLWVARRGEELDQDEILRRSADFLSMLRRPGTYRVGGLGACTLLSRRALEMGVSFAELYNVSLLGEDRHFCIRAVALGLELFADTHYPPYHIYRESDLAGVAEYKRQNFPSEGRPAASPAARPHRARGSRITLAMLVRNEAGRYLRRVLGQARKYVDAAVILDDASTDDTVEVCRTSLRGIPLELISNPEPGFTNEYALRKQLWDLAVSTDPDWILALDADEVFEDCAVLDLPFLAANQAAEVYAFRLFDMWDEEHYREDEWWNAHQRLWAVMARYLPDFRYEWQKTRLHCGRLPSNLGELKVVPSVLRLKHLGWMKPADRLAKFDRYKRLDPQGAYGVPEQYLSILDPKPNLVPWREKE